MLGTLPAVLSIHRLSVTPVLGAVPAACVPGLAPCPAEVAAIFTVPLATFLGAAGHSQRDVPWVHGPAPGVRFRLHYFEHGELGPIWRAPRAAPAPCCLLCWRGAAQGVSVTETVRQHASPARSSEGGIFVAGRSELRMS